MSSVVRQPSFVGGEFSPTLWARTEFEKYAAGARVLRNRIVTPAGAAAKRPGTYYAGRTRADARARLIPFTFSNADTLVLEFTAGFLRFFTRGVDGLPGVVLVGGLPYTIATPYGEADLPKLRYAQVGDVVTLTCAGHQPRELTRTGVAPLAFTFLPVTFDVPDFPATAGGLYLEIPLPVSVEGDATTFPARQWIFKVTAICEDYRGNVFETKPFTITQQFAFGYRPWVNTTAYLVGARVSYIGRQWVCVVADTAHAPGSSYDTNGAEPGGTVTPWDEILVGVIPSPSYADPLPAMIPCYPNKPVTVLQADLVGLVEDPGFWIKGYRVYRGRGSLFGYVGEIDPTSSRFVDSGDTPDWTRTPPKGENPFQVFDYTGALTRTENPAIVCFHEQRRVFARTDQRPGFLFLSSLNAYSIFDQHDPAVAEDAIVMELASLRWEEVRALISGRVLLAMTNGGEWAVVGGQDGAALEATGGYGARPRTERGSSWVEPIKVGDDEVLFLTPAGNVVRELSYDGNRGTYAAPDLTLISSHLFRGRSVVDWDWQEYPWSVVWVVLDDGKLLSLTYLREHGIVAWARHDTLGSVESVCCVREGTEDAVYVAVRRTVAGATRRFVERLSTAIVDDAKEGLFLDAALTYRGEPVLRVEGLGHLEGCTVSALADGYVVHGLVVAGGAVDLPAEFEGGASVVHVGLPFVSDFESLDLPPGEGKKRVKVISKVALEYEGSRGGYVGEALPAGDGVEGLEEWQQRQVEHGLDVIPLESGLVDIPIAGAYGLAGRCAFRHVDPLPSTILAITREVEYGG